MKARVFCAFAAIIATVLTVAPKAQAIERCDMVRCWDDGRFDWDLYYRERNQRQKEADEKRERAEQYKRNQERKVPDAVILTAPSFGPGQSATAPPPMKLPPELQARVDRPRGHSGRVEEQIPACVSLETYEKLLSLARNDPTSAVARELAAPKNHCRLIEVGETVTIVARSGVNHCLRIGNEVGGGCYWTLGIWKF